MASSSDLNLALQRTQGGALINIDKEQSDELIALAREKWDEDPQEGDYLLLDFFAGAGGATMGFAMAGFKPIYIVEADKTKRGLYQQNFKNVKVHQQKDENNKTSYFVQAEEADTDAETILQYIDNYSALRTTTGGWTVKFHVHASPSCRGVASVPRINNPNKKVDCLGDSKGTFEWTVRVLKKMKEELKDAMTWSIEEGPNVFKKKEYKTLRAELPKPNTERIWKFWTSGVPQTRKRYIALDAKIDFDRIGNDKFENIEPGEKGDAYLTSLMEDTYEEEFNNSKKKEISIERAFELANVKLPDGVTHMLGQNSKSQVPSLLREKNEQRLKALEEAKKKKGTTEEMEAIKNYAKIYNKLTKLAYVDLFNFVQGLDPERIKNMYQDEDILKYIQDAKDFLTDVDENMIENYIDACVIAIGKTERGKNWEEKWGEKTFYAWSTSTKQRAAQSDILLDDVLFYMKRSKLKETIEGYKVPLKMVFGIAAPKTSDLRDAFGLKLARQYSNYVTTNGDKMDAEPKLKKKREIARAAYVIEASGDKYWYRPLFREETGTETDKFWYAQGMEYSTLTEDHLKTLCTFPRAYSFAGVQLTDIRKAVGDSVPPLITMRLGLTMQYVDETSQTVSDEVALHSLLNFTPEDLSKDPLEELIDDFKEWLRKKRKRKGKKKLAKTSVELYMKEIRDHFEKHDTEFLGKGMFDTEALGYVGASRSKKAGQKGGGTRKHAAFRYWIEFLKEQKTIFNEDWFTRYANTKSLEWFKGWRQKTSQFHSDRFKGNLNKEETKQLQNLRTMLKGKGSLTKKKFERKQKRFKETRDVLVQAFEVRSYVLSLALAAIKKSAPSNQPKNANIDQLMDSDGSVSTTEPPSNRSRSSSESGISLDSGQKSPFIPPTVHEGKEEIVGDESKDDAPAPQKRLRPKRPRQKRPKMLLAELWEKGGAEPLTNLTEKRVTSMDFIAAMLNKDISSMNYSEDVRDAPDPKIPFEYNDTPRNIMETKLGMMDVDSVQLEGIEVSGDSEKKVRLVMDEEIYEQLERKGELDTLNQSKYENLTLRFSKPTKIPFSFSHYAVTPRQIMEAMKIDADSVQLEGIEVGLGWYDRLDRYRLVMDELIYKQLERKGELDTVNEVLVNKSLKYKQLTLRFSKTTKAVGRAEGMEYIFGRPSGKVTRDDVPMCVPTANSSRRIYDLDLPNSIEKAWESFQNINKTLNRDKDWKNFLPYFDNFLGRHWLRVVERHLMKVSKSNYGKNKDLDYVSVYSLNMKDELLDVHPLEKILQLVIGRVTDLVDGNNVNALFMAVVMHLEKHHAEEKWPWPDVSDYVVDRYCEHFDHTPGMEVARLPPPTAPAKVSCLTHSA
jgi:site-specific DNA-cytosine methylase